MEFIYNETASWAVDWINKVYTVLYDISKIEEVHIWWAPYRNLTYDGNTITLADAIPVWGWSPSVDYFRETVSPVTPIWDVTLWDIIDDIYDKIWQQRTNNLMYKESQILTQINTGIKRLHNMRIYKDRILSYSFNNVEQLSIQRYSATWVDITEKDHVPADWLAMINWHTFEYSTYTDGILNWTVWVVYDTNDTVTVWYKIPDGVKKISEILIDGCPVEYWDNREYFPNYKFIFETNNSTSISDCPTGSKYEFKIHDFIGKCFRHCNSTHIA